MLIRVRRAAWVVVGFSVLGLSTLYISEADAQESCPEEQVQLDDVNVPEDAEVTGALELEERNQSAAEIEMGRRTLVQREIYLTRKEGRLPPRGSRVILSKGQLFRTDPQSVIHRRNFVANAVVTGSREVTVSVCVERGRAQLEPGAFSGSLKIDDPRLEFVEIPLTVKIQYPNWLLVALFVGVAVLIAPLAVWASARHAADKPVIGDGALHSLYEWLKSNLVAVIAGFVAATGAFVASYWADPAWGAKVPEQWFTLLGTVWASATGSATVGSLASKGGSAVRKRNS